MKNIIRIALAAAATLAVTAAGAQNYRMVQAGEQKGPDGTRIYVDPATTIVVDVRIQKESTQKGPYARYAQKYFGVVAPLTDKDVYTILDAEINWYDNLNEPKRKIEALPDEVSQRDSHTNPSTGFPRVQVDRMSFATKDIETAANDAAAMIYSLRSRRLDLITGEYSETVYGEGLRAAIERIDRTENEYLELFFGKQTTTVYTERFYIVPEAGKNNYIVCRFNESQGLLPATDLTGTPIVLDARPEGKTAKLFSGEDKKKAKTGGEVFRVSDDAQCRVVEGKRELARATVPVLQYGLNVTM